jgi:lipopolysaccharide transport system permease protein
LKISLWYNPSGLETGNALKNVVKFFGELINIPAMAANLYRHREVIRILTWRDFQARFRGSIGGVLWSIIQPLFTMVIYTVVFSTFLKQRFGNTDSPFTFAVYLLCGLLPWTAFSEGLNSATTLIRNNANLVKRVVFPLEVLPLNLTFVSIIQQMIGFILLLPLSILVTRQVSASLLFIPIILIFEIMLIAGVNWIWTIIAVYIPDLKQFTLVFTSVLMFLTPIFYSKDVIPARWAWIYQINPIARIIDMYRSVFMEGIVPGGFDVLITSVICVVFFMLGYVWYMKLKKSFADFL